MKSRNAAMNAILLAQTAGVCDVWVDVAGEFHETGADDWSTVGAPPRTHGGSSAHSRAISRHSPGGGAPGHPGQRLDWQHSKHGNHVPDEKLHPMPLNPDTNNGVFTAAVTLITYVARPQKPFRGERLLTIVTRSGASAAAAIPISEGIFVGVDLQQVQAGNIPIEFWVVNAFGVRLYMVDANPGIEVRMPVVLTSALAGADTLTALIMILGRALA